MNELLFDRDGEMSGYREDVRASMERGMEEEERKQEEKEGEEFLAFFFFFEDLSRNVPRALLGVKRRKGI